MVVYPSMSCRVSAALYTTMQVLHTYSSTAHAMASSKAAQCGRMDVQIQRQKKVGEQQARVSTNSSGRLRMRCDAKGLVLAQTLGQYWGDIMETEKAPPEISQKLTLGSNWLTCWRVQRTLINGKGGCGASSSRRLSDRTLVDTRYY